VCSSDLTSNSPPKSPEKKSGQKGTSKTAGQHGTVPKGVKEGKGGHPGMEGGPSGPQKEPPKAFSPPLPHPVHSLPHPQTLPPPHKVNGYSPEISLMIPTPVNPSLRHKAQTMGRNENETDGAVASRDTPFSSNLPLPSFFFSFPLSFFLSFNPSSFFMRVNLNP